MGGSSCDGPATTAPSATAPPATRPTGGPTRVGRLRRRRPRRSGSTSSATVRGSPLETTRACPCPTCGAVEGRDHARPPRCRCTWCRSARDHRRPAPAARPGRARRSARPAGCRPVPRPGAGARRSSAKPGGVRGQDVELGQGLAPRVVALARAAGRRGPRRCPASAAPACATDGEEMKTNRATPVGRARRRAGSGSRRRWSRGTAPGCPDDAHPGGEVDDGVDARRPPARALPRP